MTTSCAYSLLEVNQMKTRLDLNQIEGLGLATLAENLELIKHIRGQVNTAADLMLLSPNVDDQVFVREENATYRYTVDGWVKVSAAGNGGGGGGGGFTGQVTKLNVIASSAAPHVVTIDIPVTTDFMRPTPEILKFVPGATGQVQTLVSFDNSDSTDFEPNEFVEFDGKMRLKTRYETPMVEDTTWTGEGKVYTATIDVTRFKKIESIEVI